MVELIKRLLASSAKGKVDWEPTVNEGVYQAAFADFSVQVRVRTGQLSDDYGLQIYDREGRLMEDVWDTDLDSSSAGSANLERMRALYTVARRRALGVDEALDKILSELEPLVPDDDVPF